MAVRKAVSQKAKKTDEVVESAPVINEAEERRPAAPRTAKSAQKEEEARKKAIGLLHPGSVKFMKDKLGLDVTDPRAVDTKTLFDIVQGKVTKPMQIVVTPLAYDREQKKNVEMPKVNPYVSLRFVFPKEKGVPVEPDNDKHRIGVTSIPCLPLLEKAEGYEVAREAKAEPAKEQKNPTFTPEEILCLEGVGISRERLYGGFNHLSREEKTDIAEGRKFFVNGSVKTDFGFVNVTGEAKLVKDSEGKVSARFQSIFPEQREPNTVIDLMTARRQGLLELDFFLRDSNGKAISDVNGVPMLNKAGENLTKYGMAMEPVVGYIHGTRRDEKTGEWKDVTTKANYLVTVVEGNLYATRMKEVEELGKDGKPMTYKDRKGVERTVTHPEVTPCVVKDGMIYLDGHAGKPLEPASKKDLENYLQGKPAVVKGATYHDFKTNKDEVYDAVVVADNRLAGFGKPFTPATSKEIKAGMKEDHTERKKQNFAFKI